MKEVNERSHLNATGKKDCLPKGFELKRCLWGFGLSSACILWVTWNVKTKTLRAPRNVHSYTSPCSLALKGGYKKSCKFTSETERENHSGGTELTAHSALKPWVLSRVRSKGLYLRTWSGGQVCLLSHIHVTEDSEWKVRVANGLNLCKEIILTNVIQVQP